MRGRAILEAWPYSPTWLKAEGFRVRRFTEGQNRSKPEVVMATIAQAVGR